MLKTKEKNYYIILIFIFIYFMISFITIKAASIYVPKNLGNLLLKQTVYYCLGIIVYLLSKKIKINFLFKYINYLYITGVILLIFLLFFGVEINGSKCWIIIPILGSFQVSEFIKIILVLKLSYDIGVFFKIKRKLKEQIVFMLKCIIIILIPSILTFFEPDTGAVIIYLLTSYIIFLLSPFNKKIILASIFFIFIMLFICIFFYRNYNEIFIRIVGNNIFYRIDRIINWKNQAGMQLENSLIAIGSAGIYGYGFNKTPIYFPEPATDFIFSVFASNYGFIGSLLLIIFVLIFDFYLINIISNKKKLQDKLVVIGFMSIIIIQQLQNISMTIGLVPITGITLPFISYGGSSLLSVFVMLSIIDN